MQISQILILAFLLFIIIHILSLKGLTSTRILFISLLGTGVLFVLMPDLTTKIANAIGIGRGTDLIIYLFVIFNLYQFIFMLAEQNRLLKMVTVMGREIALLKAQVGQVESLPENNQFEQFIRK